MDLRITGTDAIKDVMDKYSNVSADYFSLKEDGDTAKVRFAHGDDKDLDIYVVHKVKIANKDKYVACLSPANMPCPLCKAGHKASVRLFLTIQDMRDQKLKIWDRGKTEIPNILGLISRYGRLDSRMYEIQRHGKKGDTDTQYQFFPLDPTPECSTPLKKEPICSENGYIWQRTPEELESLLNQIAGPSATTYGAQAQAPASAGRMF